jgi:hypothetical protein
MDGPLNNLKLGPAMLEALYRNSLVDLNTNVPSPINVKQTSRSIAFLGNNARNVLVLVRNNAQEFLSEAEHSFFTKLLKACNLELNDVAVVNLAKENALMERITKQLNPAHIISFGTGAGNELFRMENVDGRKYLNAPRLSDLVEETEKSKQLKAKLWSELKMMFGLD